MQRAVSARIHHSKTSAQPLSTKVASCSSTTCARIALRHSAVCSFEQSRFHLGCDRSVTVGAWGVERRTKVSAKLVDDRGTIWAVDFRGGDGLVALALGAGVRTRLLRRAPYIHID